MFNSDKIEKIVTIYGHFQTLKGDMITDQLKQYSAHTRNELAMLKSLIADGDNIIDIGAHIGTFAVPFARFNKGKGKIFSFEADPDNYNLLKQNITENGLDDTIVPMHAIVSDKNIRFKKLKTRIDNSATYYFLPDVNATDMNIPVEVINIDEWYIRYISEIKIDVIKIDVEGAELAALCSCENIIRKYYPLLYIEINSMALARFKVTADEIEEKLKSFGYHFFRNAGLRNSDNDTFKIECLKKVEDGGTFFDLLAVHPSSSRYPDIK